MASANNTCGSFFMLLRKGDVMLLNCLVVSCGGFVWSILRYLVGNAVPASSFPWATLAVNVVGSFALAAIAGLVPRGVVPDGGLSLMLRVGLCGGFTTVSTFSLEVVDLTARGAWLRAVGYALATCALCVAAAMAGGALVSGTGDVFFVPPIY